MKLFFFFNIWNISHEKMLDTSSQISD